MAYERLKAHSSYYEKAFLIESLVKAITGVEVGGKLPFFKWLSKIICLAIIILIFHSCNTTLNLLDLV